MDEKTKLSREWVMVMLYKKPMRLDDLIINGCEVMVYGWDLPEFRNIISDMVNEDNPVLEMNRTTGILSLTTDGIFYIKKHALLPLMKIANTPDLLSAFIEENKHRCNVEFLSTLSKEPGELEKESRIKSFAKNHYEDIAKILIILIPFLATYS